MKPGMIGSGIAAGFVATVVLSAMMLIKHYMGLLPQLNPIEDIVHVADHLTGMTLPLPFGWIGHFVLGTVAWGIIYAALQASLPGARSGRQGPYFRSSGLARDDDHLRAPGRRWLIRAVARASGDGGDACSSPYLRRGSGRGLRLARHQTEFGRQLFPLNGIQFGIGAWILMMVRVVGDGETAGFIKVGVEAQTDHLLGAAAPANDGELDLMDAGAPYQAYSVASAGVDHA